MATGVWMRQAELQTVIEISVIMLLPKDGLVLSLELSRISRRYQL